MSKAAARWREQYDRMQRWWARLHEPSVTDERLRDDFYAFFVTCFHLRDWLTHDSSIPLADREKLRPLLWEKPQKQRKRKMRSRAGWDDPWPVAMQTCADIANGVKHLKRTQLPRLDAKMRLLVASRTREIVVEIHVPRKGGRPVRRRVSAETIAGRCMAYWDELLQREKLL